MNIVTIMNYPPENREYAKMCHIWIDTVIKNNGDNILILYHDHKPDCCDEFKQKANITFEKRKMVGDIYATPPERSHGRKRMYRFKRIYRHFNLQFKLPVLASLKTDFIFIDSDAYVLGDLNYLWERRKDKPWIGIDHQPLPYHRETRRKRFLNSGVQIVGDPNFYNLKEVVKSHEKNNLKPMCTGRDQALLFGHFKRTGYDYTHPEIGFEWNSCARVGVIKYEDEKWSGNTRGLRKNHPVYINHYWAGYKPWIINCPIHASYSMKWIYEPPAS